MFQILMLLSSYYSCYVLSNSIYNNFVIKNNNYYNNNNIYNYNLRRFNYRMAAQEPAIFQKLNNIKKNINTRISFLNFDNIKHIDIGDKFVNFNFDPNLIINHKTDVYIHIEKLYTRLPIYHIGLSFFNGYRTVRYDYRPFNENGSYITIDSKENDTFKNNIIHSKTIYWCQIDLPLNYIDKCEREIVDTYPKYRLGINDCRHYARRLTSKTTRKPTPVWKLYKIWNSV